LEKYSVGTGVSSIFGRNWKERHFVLSAGDGLCYYGSAAAKQAGQGAKRAIPLYDTPRGAQRTRVVVMPTAEDTNGAVTPEKHDLLVRFEVQGVPRFLLMRAPNATEHARWAFALQQHAAAGDLVEANLQRRRDAPNT
jgi:hypothetical protein